MAKTCMTSEGDLLDSLCHLNGTLEAVLAANQGLADEAQPFRAGVLILLPALAVQTSGTLLLWD